MRRYRFPDIVKGIGILLVVLGHATFVPDSVLSYIYSFHMPLFFIISGMLIYITDSKSHEYPAFLKSRVRRILIPYAVFSIIYTLIDIVNYRFLHTAVLEDIIINSESSLSLAGSGPLWFLPTLLIAELLFVALLKRLNPARGLMLSSVCGIVALCLLPAFRNIYLTCDNIHVRNLPLNLLLVCLRSTVCLIFYVIGYLSAILIKAYIDKPSSIKKALPNACLFCVGTAFLIINFLLSLTNMCKPEYGYSNVDMHYMDIGNPPVFILRACLGSFGLILIAISLDCLCEKKPFVYVYRILAFWGRGSLVIMATHLNCYVLYVADVFAFAMNNYITRAKDYMLILNIMLAAMTIESLLLLIIKRFAPGLLGKNHS